MTTFKREERYIVIKRKNLHGTTEDFLRNFLCANNITTQECVVVDKDWPEYENVWSIIEKRYNNKQGIE